MGMLIIYWGIMAACYFAAGKLKKPGRDFGFLNPVLNVVVFFMVFLMGMKMGANEEVMGNLNSIGLYGLIMTIAIIAGSVLSVMLARKLFGMDRYGNFLENAPTTKAAAGELSPTSEGSLEPEEEPSKGLSTTTIIVICVVGGLLFGWLIADKLFSDMNAFDDLGGMLIRIGLCLMLFLIGFDMGVEGTVIDNFKRAGWRVIAFPFFIMAGTLAASAICAIFLPITLREGLAIGAGFGWYSFAPAAIMERGHITAGAISFMHNIIREYISVLTIPIVAKRVGYLEGMSVCGCSAMDVCLPIIERSTRSDIAVYAFISGAVQSMAVPILVPLLLG